jgi:hypothetical protein
MRVSFLQQRTNKPHHISYPVRAFHRQLRDLGHEATVHYSLDSGGLTDCDVLVALEGDFSYLLPPDARGQEEVIATLDHLRARVPALAWLDESDSSGHLLSHLLPHVDLFLKSHLLVDTSRYDEPAITGVLYRDHYIRAHGLEDTTWTWRGPIGEAGRAKLALGWNFGQGDWSMQAGNRIRRWIALHKPWAGWHLRRGTKPFADRTVDITYCVGPHVRAPSAGYQRTVIHASLDRLAAAGGLEIRREGNLRRRQYLTELRDSRVAPSPFGFGELCYRDFEAFAAGALVVKPAMDHMVTFPDYFIDGTTFVAHSWDMEELDDLLRDVTTDLSRSEAIAREGQRAFFESLSPTGGEAFALHLDGILQRARSVART